MCNVPYQSAMAESHTCTRKQYHRKVGSAIDEAIRLANQEKAVFVVYKCQYCGMYHKGHESKWGRNAIYRAILTEVE